MDTVALSVCHTAGCANTAKRINVLFGVEYPGYPRNIMLYMGVPCISYGHSEVWGEVRCGLSAFPNLLSIAGWLMTID